MKISRILLILILTLSINVQAQNFYIRGGAGITMSTSANYSYSYSLVDYGFYQVITAKKQSLGSGVPFVLAGGYKINNYFAVELGVDYFYGFAYKTEQTATSYDNYSYSTKLYGQMLSLVPAFVISVPAGKFQPYARLGAKIGVLSNIFYSFDGITVNTISSPPGVEVNSLQKSYGGVPVGVQAAMGTDFKLSERISLFGEIQVDGINYTPTKGKYTSYSEKGVDLLPTMTVKQKSWIYVEETDSQKPIPSDQPQEKIKTAYHFGNVGVMVGVKVAL